MPTVSFRVDDELKGRLDRLVERKGLNVSAVFRQAVLDKVEELEHGPREAAGFSLSLKERLALANQYRILAALHPNEREHYLGHVEALQSGYELHYPAMVEAFDSGLGKEDCSEVLDILQMYDDLAYSYDALADKDGLTEVDVTFPGFDGNNETARMAYARYFVVDLDRYARLKATARKTGFNSHFPAMARYRRMLPAHRRLSRPPSGLSAADIRAILRAGEGT